MANSPARFSARQSPVLAPLRLGHAQHFVDRRAAGEHLAPAVVRAGSASLWRMAACSMAQLLARSWANWRISSVRRQQLEQPDAAAVAHLPALAAADWPGTAAASSGLAGKIGAAARRPRAGRPRGNAGTARAPAAGPSPPRPCWRPGTARRPCRPAACRPRPRRWCAAC